MYKTRSAGDMLFVTLNYGLLLLLGLFTLYPFMNLLAISLNDSIDTVRGGIHIWPRIWTATNYEIVFSNPQLLSATLLSLLRTVVGTLLSVTVTTMLAYTLSRRDYMLRRAINYVLVISMYVSGGLIPFYLLVKQLHLMNSFWVYILPGLIGAFNVLIIRSYFEQLPEGFSEAARIDGASDVQILFRVLVPVSMPVIATVTLFVSVGHWNSWFDNYLYNTSPSLSLLQYELMKILLQSVSQLTGGASATGHVDTQTLASTSPESIRATMTVIVTIPILFVYPFLQKYFIKGMTIGAMKE
ncbi:carbohydrate ABC transporter permease [Cohnella sp. 56]|uniref:carbohydrate ABC transporter permease n=1 Tax=Cohnella sp. 56 TaxID=3113722 RepID=UPI0030E8BB1A